MRRAASRRFAGIAFGLMLCSLAQASIASAEPTKLASVKVQLPFGDLEFAGPGAETVNGICLACHSAEMIFTQPKLSAAVWTQEVVKMRNVFKAPIADADIPAIVAYLVKLQDSN